MLKKINLFVLSVIVITTLMGAGCISLSGQSKGVMGMFRSDNKGDSWKAIVSYPTVQGVKSLSGLRVYKIFTDPSDQNAFYLSTRGQGLYYSYDNGESWQAVAVLNNKFIYGLAVDPKDKCNIYVTDGSHIYRTTDCLRNWELMFTEERPTQRFVDLVVSYKDPKIIYAIQTNGDFLRSGDSGVSWRIVKRFGVEVRTLIADPAKSDRLYLASYKNGLHRSDDGGVLWTDLSKGFDSFSDSKTFNRLVLNQAQKDSLFWISKYGILRSDDAGVTWKELKLLTAPGSINIYSFGINPKNQSEIYYTGTILDNKNQNVRSTFYRSTDGGVNWITKKLPTNTIPTAMLIHPINTAMIFLGFTTLDQPGSAASATNIKF
jgi:photosystem II stability/assembly factor-like uncharacterized protein